MISSIADAFEVFFAAVFLAGSAVHPREIMDSTDEGCARTSAFPSGEYSLVIFMSHRRGRRSFNRHILDLNGENGNRDRILAIA